VSADKQTILRKRAEVLARKPPPAPVPEPQLDMIVFGIGRDRYALEAGFVRAVVSLKEITPLPSLPGFVRGVVNVRGDILAAIDLGRLLGVPDDVVFAHVVVVKDGDAEFGLLASETFGWQSVAVSAVLPARDSRLKGVTKQGVAVLDGAKLLEAVSV